MITGNEWADELTEFQQKQLEKECKRIYQFFNMHIGRHKRIRPDMPFIVDIKLKSSQHDALEKQLQKDFLDFLEMKIKFEPRKDIFNDTYYIGLIMPKSCETPIESLWRTFYDSQEEIINNRINRIKRQRLKETFEPTNPFMD